PDPAAGADLADCHRHRLVDGAGIEVLRARNTGRSEPEVCRVRARTRVRVRVAHRTVPPLSCRCSPWPVSRRRTGWRAPGATDVSEVRWVACSVAHDDR